MSRKAKAGACDAGLHHHCKIGELVVNIEKIPVTQALEARADRFVSDLIAAGAINLHTDGERWWHDCRPGYRDACRRVKAQHDVTSPGMPASIVRAIGRLRRAAA